MSKIKISLNTTIFIRPNSLSNKATCFDLKLGHLQAINL